MEKNARLALAESFEKAVREGRFLKMTLSRPPLEEAEKGLKNVFFRPVEIKKSLKIQLNFRFSTRDEAKNLTADEAFFFLKNALDEGWLGADLFSTDGQTSLLTAKNGAQKLLFKKTATEKKAAPHQHDREKTRLIEPTAPYLEPLGISNGRGEILQNAQDKWRQINHFLEIIDSILRSKNDWPRAIKIADMGCGKGYLTFALFDFLKNRRGFEPLVEGLELRQNLVDFCNQLAQSIDYQGLTFAAKNILNFTGDEKLDILIALHACDTATDLAIAGGVRAEAEAIVVAPCCHKQVRKSLAAKPPALAPIFRHGILEERQAEILTDSIRALLMESRGYRTQVFEFISTEHTAKNLMIVGSKSKPDAAARGKIEALKNQFGLAEHFLETLI